MPHQCVRCGTLYDDGAAEILKGCPCGARLFFYIKKSRLDELRAVQSIQKLSTEEKAQMEHDVYDMVGAKYDSMVQPIVLDFESIRVLRPGHYELDIVQIFRGEPLVFKLEDGKYMIDLAATFRTFKKE